MSVDRVALQRPATPDPNRVVVIHTGDVGEFVAWMNAAKAIAAFYQEQGKHVTLIASSEWASWAAELHLFDEVLGLEERRFTRDLRYRIAAGKNIRQMCFGTAVRPAYTRVLEEGDSMVRLTGATSCVGPAGVFQAGGEGARRASDAWYTRLTPTDPGKAGEMQRDAAFVRELTGRDYRASLADLRPQADLQLQSEFLERLRGRSFFVLSPGASSAEKRWPAERFVAIASRLARATGWVGVICGDRSEGVRASQMCDEAAIPLLNWVGRTDLKQLIAVLAGAEVVIGSESSTMHLAAAVGKPAVCVVAGGQYGRYLPYTADESLGRPMPVVTPQPVSCLDCEWRCAFRSSGEGPAPCLEKVSVEAVWTSVLEALQSREPRGVQVPAPPKRACAAKLQPEPLVLLH